MFLMRFKIVMNRLLMLYFYNNLKKKIIVKNIVDFNVY